MLAIKLLGGCLLAVTGYEAGRRRVAVHANRLNILQELERMLLRIGDEIQYRGSTLEEIRDLLIMLGNFKSLQLEQCTELQNLQLPQELTPTQQRVMEQAFRTLGQRTSQESVVQLEYYRQLCVEFSAQEKLQLNSAKQLYRQLGICAGLVLTLLLL